MTAGGPGSPVFDTTSLDYDGIITDLVSYAQSTYPTELWTDFNPSNNGTYELGLMAYASDLLSYTANAQILEAIVTTVVREQNFRNIVKMYDYTLKSASPSSVVEVLTLDPAGTYPFTVSSHLQLGTTDGIVFQPIGNTSVSVYPPGGTVSIDVVQGEEFFEEAEGQTDGTPGQQFVLKNSPILDGTLELSVGMDTYLAVTNAISAGSSDKVYTTATDENGVTTITFGDGINGIIPPRSQYVYATYKTGGGLNTNVAPTTINRIVGTSDGSQVPAQILSVTNLVSAEDGGPKQSLANAKANLPLTLKSNERCITPGDYAAETERVTGVFKANAVPGKFQGGSSPMLLFVVPQGGGYPTDVLRNQIQVHLASRKSGGKRVRVLDPTYVDLFMELDLYVLPTSPALVVSNRVRAALDLNYGLDAADFGETYDLQDAYEQVSPAEIVGVGRVYFKTFTVNPYFARHVNTPTTGNGDVEGISVNLDTVQRREWLIQVIAPNPPNVLVTQFTVLQRRLGTVSGATDTLLMDQTADYETSELGGWTLHPNPETSTQTFPITGNTPQSISVQSGLLLYVEPTDPYVVEKMESKTGKILRSTLVTAANGPFVTISSVSSFSIGDKVRIWFGSQETITTITALNNVSNTLSLADSVVAPAGAFVDYVWVSDDGSVQFSVIDGPSVSPAIANPSPFVVGDQLYVDTFPRTGDIQLRDETFPSISDANITIKTVGGVQ